MEYEFFDLLSKSYPVVETDGYTKGVTSEKIKSKYDTLPVVDQKYIDEFVSWLEDKAASRPTDYTRALLELRDSKQVPDYKINLLLSALNIYFKDKKAQRERDLSTSTFQGEVGEYITFTVKEMKVISSNYYSYRGPETIFWRIVGTDDNIYMWSTTVEFDEGDTIGAKVKAHRDYKGEKQTIITRGKVISPLKKDEDELPSDDMVDFSNSVYLSDIYSTE